MCYRKLVRVLLVPIVASLCFAAIISLQVPRLNVQRQQPDKLEALRQEELERLHLSLIKRLPTFGFKNLVGDWAFLNFIQYFGDGPVREQIGYSLSPEYFEIVVHHNPRLVNAYFYLSPATSLFAGRPDRTVALIEKGLQSISPKTHPKAYFLWFYKAVDELLFLSDYKAARRSYELAAQWADISTDPSGKRAAARARETAQFLSKNPDSKHAHIGAWATILSNARDEATRQIVIYNIEKLGGKVKIAPNGNLQVIVPNEK